MSLYIRFLSYLSDVPAHGVFKQTYTVTPVHEMENAMVFSFDCKNLPDITGSAVIRVVP